MDEMQNIHDLQEYMDTNSTVQHLTKAISIFFADVLYQDDVYEDVFLRNTEIRYLHSYNNEITISELSLPYYNNFRLSQQHFENKKGMLIISGVHHDDSTKKYTIRVGGISLYSLNN